MPFVVCLLPGCFRIRSGGLGCGGSSWSFAYKDVSYLSVHFLLVRILEEEFFDLSKLIFLITALSDLIELEHLLLLFDLFVFLGDQFLLLLILGEQLFGDFVLFTLCFQFFNRLSFLVQQKLRCWVLVHAIPAHFSREA